METKSIIKCVAHKRPLTQGCSECLSPDAWDVFEEPVSGHRLLHDGYNASCLECFEAERDSKSN